MQIALTFSDLNSVRRENNVEPEISENGRRGISFVPQRSKRGKISCLTFFFTSVIFTAYCLRIDWEEMGNSVGGQGGLCVKLSDSWGGVDKPWLSVPAHRQYYLSELCRPYGASVP